MLRLPSPGGPELDALALALDARADGEEEEDSSHDDDAHGWHADARSGQGPLGQALKSVAETWPDIVASDHLTLRPILGALTNKVFECCWPRKGGKDPRRVIVRVYGDGTAVFFRREDEMKTFECMSAAGQGPKLLARFDCGRVEEFLHARTLTAWDMKQPGISVQVALKLREFHSLQFPSPMESFLWTRLRRWLAAACEVATDEQAAEFRLPSLENEITALESRLARNGERLAFCHNDLQYGNIMVDLKDGFITLIDYEYSCYNAVAFDIVNHFCEWAADYHTDTPHVLDYTKYPDLSQRKRFVEAYLQESDGSAARAEDVDALLWEVDEYAVASHLHWGLWGLISGAVNNIDFNYLEYGRQRFTQYEILKGML